MSERLHGVNWRTMRNTGRNLIGAAVVVSGIMGCSPETKKPNVHSSAGMNNEGQTELFVPKPLNENSTEFIVVPDGDPALPSIENETPTTDDVPDYYSLEEKGNDESTTLTSEDVEAALKDNLLYRDEIPVLFVTPEAEKEEK